jgi:thiaminase
MSAQEIIQELMKLNREELAQIDSKLDELLKEKPSPAAKSWAKHCLRLPDRLGTCRRITLKIMIIIFIAAGRGLHSL